MGATIREIVDDALTVVGEVAGPGVEVYGEDRMLKDAVRAFNLLWKKYDWEQYISWYTLTLDGVTGKVTTNDLANVRDFDDFKGVYRNGSEVQLPILTGRMNPNTITGSDVRYWSSLPATDTAYATKKLKFWPLASTGQVDICAKVYPRPDGTPWVFDDRMELDKDMLVYGVAYMTLSADETNAAAADNQRMLMESRFADIKANLADKPIRIIGSGSTIPNQWFVPN